MSTITRRGNSWILNWSDDHGQHRVSLGTITKQEAEKARRLKDSELAARKPTWVGPMFEVFSETYLDWYAAEYPASYYRVSQIVEMYLVPEFRGKRLLAIRRFDAEQYKIKRLQAGAAPATVAKEIRQLGALLNKAVLWEQVPYNPIKGIKPPRDVRSKPPVFYTVPELERIYKASTEHKDALWKLLANTGLRRSEALNLRLTDIGSESIRVVSTDEARTKSGKWREVPLNEFAQEAIDVLRPESAGSTYLLQRVNPRSLTRAFDRTLRRAGLDGSTHCLRHTFCSHLVMAGVPLRVVQALAGHASVKTTEKYAHLMPGAKQDAVAKIRL